MDANNPSYELYTLLALLLFLVLGMPIGYKEMLKKKKEGKTAEYVVFGIGLIGGITLFIILIMSGYEKFIKNAA